MKNALNFSMLLGSAALCVPLAAIAQDTRGVPQDEYVGTVVKGKAPVAKELLRVHFPKPKAFKLKNGLAVYVLEDHRMPAVRFSLQIRAGSLYELRSGAASLTASMLTEGTSSRTGAQIAEQTEDMGANLGAFAGLDSTTISASGLSTATDTLIALMADVVMNPAFPEDRLKRTKSQLRSMVSQRRTNPNGMLTDLAARVFYGRTAFGRVSPTAREIAAVTPDDLHQFHDAFYVPNGATLGVTGDVEVKSLRTKLEVAFAGWKPGPVTAAPATGTFPSADSTHVYLIDRPASAQTVLQFGALAVSQSDPDYIPLVVANRILGGGSAGRLFQNIRERKGYTYGAYSTVAASPWQGIWGASASVRTVVTEPAVAEFFKEFKRLRDEPVSASELDQAKRSLLGGFALTLENSEGMLGRTLELVRVGLPLDYWDKYPARIQAVTAADVQRVAQKYLADGRIQLLAVGERKAIEAGLAKFGPVQIVEADKIGEL
jgi:predicted Zn-dependent peptidase